MANQGDKRSSYSWLATESADYGSDEFSSVLAGKLRDLSTNNSGPATNVHYTNVALAYSHLYGFDVEDVGANAAAVTRSGEQGNIAELRIPATAAQLHKAWNIIVGPELTWSAVPSTTDFASEAKAVTVRNALNYYWTHENVGQVAKSAAFEALAFAEGCLHIPWDSSAGKDIGVDATTNPERHRILKSGDIRYSKIPTWDIVRDPTAKSWDSLNWIIVREWHDKFDMAASCDSEEKAQQCLSSTVANATGQNWTPFKASYNQDSDRIPVYYLYAKRTPSVPGGRQSVFLENGTLISDGPLDEAYVTQLPVVRMAAGEYSGTPWPYSKFFACLGSAQAADALYKDLLTNATAVSGCVISVEADNVDAGAAITTLSGGPQLVTRPKDTKPPEVLQLQQATPEHFNLITRLRNEVQQIIGLDNLTAGEDIGANLSGAAMVMMTSTSVQNNSQLQANWVSFVQQIGNVTLKHIQYHMSEPKKIALAGNARSSLVSTTEVSGDSVEGIERVTVSIGSALQQTDAGKYEIATTALKEGWAQTPEQFQTVLDTGRLDALTQDLSNELMLINAENEALGKGEDVPVMLDDNHVLHLKMHRAVIASLTARRKPEVVKALQAHQDKHLDILRQTDPSILQLFGQPVLAPAGGPPQAPQGPDMKLPKQLPQGTLPGQAPPLRNPLPPDVIPPTAPKDPRTGKPAEPVAGTTPPGLSLRPPKAA